MANAHDCGHLPIGLKTLYHLSKLDRGTLERLIGQGVIHPALKESEARELAVRFRGKSIEARVRKANVRHLRSGSLTPSRLRLPLGRSGRY
jgi:hypothetical protein